jgi:cation diffusion facilitator CzcD-associated flavoprotein CzcO
MSRPTSALPVAVIGAGPVGLAATAHLIVRGLPVQVFEAGPAVAAHLAGYAQVRLFSPWRYNIDSAARALLEAEGWAPPDDRERPTAGELVRDYLAPLARTRAIAPVVRYGGRVTVVSRAGFDKSRTSGREASPFLLRVEVDGRTEEHRAWAVIDASGTWSQPNPVGGNGLPALGEPEHRNSTALRISSSSSQKSSRRSRVTSLIAKARPWLPMNRPATTIAIGADRCR